MSRSGWVVISVVSLVMAAFSVFRMFNGPEYGASANGTLDNSYTEKRGRRGRVSYDVSYTFVVDGKSFRGEDNISDRPSSPSRQIFYDPQNPNDSGLSRKKHETWVFVLLVVGIIGASTAGKRASGASAS